MLPLEQPVAACWKTPSRGLATIAALLVDSTVAWNENRLPVRKCPRSVRGHQAAMLTDWLLAQPASSFRRGKSQLAGENVAVSAREANSAATLQILAKVTASWQSSVGFVGVQRRTIIIFALTLTPYSRYLRPNVHASPELEP